MEEAYAKQTLGIVLSLRLDKGRWSAWKARRAFVPVTLSERCRKHNVAAKVAWQLGSSHAAEVLTGVAHKHAGYTGMAPGSHMRLMRHHDEEQGHQDAVHLQML